MMVFHFLLVMPCDRYSRITTENQIPVGTEQVNCSAYISVFLLSWVCYQFQQQKVIPHILSFLLFLFKKPFLLIQRKNINKMKIQHSKRKKDSCTTPAVLLDKYTSTPTNQWLVLHPLQFPEAAGCYWTLTTQEGIAGDIHSSKPHKWWLHLLQTCIW